MTYRETIEVRLARLEEKEAAAQLAVATELMAIRKILDAGHVCIMGDRFTKLETNMKWFMRVGGVVVAVLMWLNQQALWHSIQRIFA